MLGAENIKRAFKCPSCGHQNWTEQNIGKGQITLQNFKNPLGSQGLG
jgi:predicted nucleic-acid-binding Zn-ribbon protein